jgi:multiple sugar transport system ATP-binding protein
MDEPLSNLDAKLRVQMRTQISRLQRRLGTTTVYVTHDQTEAMTLGDRVVVMRQGLVQQIGTPAQLYDLPRNLFVAGFIGSPAMNFVNATLEGNVLRSPLGDLPVDDRTRQSLERQNAPRELIVGLRPEAFDDVALAPDRGREGPVLTVTVDVLESLGSDVYVYFTAEGGPATTAELEELAADSGVRDTGAGGAQHIVARLDAATRAREGEPLELRVDMSKAHVFDPATGANLTHPERV